MTSHGETCPKFNAAVAQLGERLTVDQEVVGSKPISRAIIHIMEVVMKTVYTSNYARNAKHPDAISISVVRPRWYPNIAHMPALGPTWDMVKEYKETSNVSEYTRQFWNLLLVERQLKVEEVIESIPDNAILLCWEKPTDFCHRHLVAKWLRDNGAYVRELTDPKKTIPYAVRTMTESDMGPLYKNLYI